MVYTLDLGTDRCQTSADYGPCTLDRLVLVPDTGTMCMK